MTYRVRVFAVECSAQLTNRAQQAVKDNTKKNVAEKKKQDKNLKTGGTQTFTCVSLKDQTLFW